MDTSSQEWVDNQLGAVALYHSRRRLWTEDVAQVCTLHEQSVGRVTDCPHELNQKTYSSHSRYSGKVRGSCVSDQWVTEQASVQGIILYLCSFSSASCAYSSEPPMIPILPAMPLWPAWERGGMIALRTVFIDIDIALLHHQVLRSRDLVHVSLGTRLHYAISFPDFNIDLGTSNRYTKYVHTTIDLVLKTVSVLSYCHSDPGSQPPVLIGAHRLAPQR